MRLKSFRLVFDVFERLSVRFPRYKLFLLVLQQNVFFVHTEPTNIALLLQVIHSNNAPCGSLGCLQFLFFNFQLHALLGPVGL